MIDELIEDNEDNKEEHLPESKARTTTAMTILDLVEKNEKVLVITRSATSLSRRLIMTKAGIDRISPQHPEAWQIKAIKAALDHLYSKRGNIYIVDDKDADFSTLERIVNDNSISYLVLDFPMRKERITKLEELGIPLVKQAFQSPRHASKSEY